MQSSKLIERSNSPFQSSLLNGEFNLSVFLRGSLEKPLKGIREQEFITRCSAPQCKYLEAAEVAMWEDTNAIQLLGVAVINVGLVRGENLGDPRFQYLKSYNGSC